MESGEWCVERISAFCLCHFLLPVVPFQAIFFIDVKIICHFLLIKIYDILEIHPRP